MVTSLVGEMVGEMVIEAVAHGREVDVGAGRRPENGRDPQERSAHSGQIGVERLTVSSATLSAAGRTGSVVGFSSVGTQAVAKRRALHDDGVGVVAETIEGTLSEERVVE